MTDQPFSINNLKRLPHHSSTDVQRIGEEAQRLHDAAAARYAIIYGFTDLQSFISASGMDCCLDSLAAIRQIDAALADLTDHFSNTVARNSLEFSHNGVKELLRKSDLGVKQLATYVER